MPHSNSHEHAEHIEHAAHGHGTLTDTQKRKAVFTAVLAVGIALASVWLDGLNRELLLTRDEASNLWGYFHEKSLKERIYESELSFASDLSPARTADLQKEIIRYKQEEKQIQKDADTKEELVKYLLKRTHTAEFTAVLFELAIVLVSISLVMESVLLVALAALAAGSGAGLAAVALLFSSH